MSVERLDHVFARATDGTDAEMLLTRAQARVIVALMDGPAGPWEINGRFIEGTGLLVCGPHPEDGYLWACVYEHGEPYTEVTREDAEVLRAMLAANGGADV